MRSGKEYIEKLSRSRRDVWIQGTKVENLVQHPALSNCVKSIAGLYDLQQQNRGILSIKPTSQEIPLSFHMPRNTQELQKKGQAFYRWAVHSGGMLGRTPDYLNAIVTSWASASQFFGKGPSDFSKNILNYYQMVSSKDYFLTHSVLNAYRLSGSQRVLDTTKALKVVKEDGKGIVVDGVRHLATSSAISDEILIYAGRISNLKAGDEDFSLAFAVDADTPGIKMVAREPFDTNSSHFDFPLSSRFEEMDFLISFNNVSIPWERVFIYRDFEKLNKLHAETNSVVHSAHQTAWKTLAKTEFILGSLFRYIEYNSSPEIPHLQQALAEVIIQMEVIKSLIIRAEVEAETDKWGMVSPRMLPLEVARVLYMQSSEQLTKIVKNVGAGGLMLIFSENDLSGKLKKEMDEMLAEGQKTALDRVKWNRVLWDISSSSFGSRQELYEKLYAGGVQPSLQFLFKSLPKEEIKRLTEIVDSVLSR